jgi:hypothetical protein
MRIGNDREATAIVQINVPGSRATQVAYVGHAWSTVLVNLPEATPLMPRQRINLALQNVQAPLASSNMGVYVGPIRILAAQ